MKEKQEVLVLTEQKQKHSNIIHAHILKAASAMGITAGAVGIFFTLGGTPIFAVPFLASAVSVMVISSLDSLIKGKFYGTFLCLAAAAVLFFLSVSSVIRGIYAWYSHFRSIWNQVFHTFYREFTVSGYRAMDTKMAGMILALLCAAVVCELIRRKSLVLLTLVVFVPLCFSMLLSVRLPVWVSAVLIAGWISAWCSISGPAGIRWETAVLAAGTLAILSILPSVSSGTLWQKAAGEFGTSIRQRIKTLRFGADTLPEGDLIKADRMLAGSEDRLLLEMEKMSPVYLRGFIGSKYEGSHWQQFQAEIYSGEFSGMLSWLENQGFYPGRQYAIYQEASSEEKRNQKETVVSVENIGANRRYVYLPETVSHYSENAGKWKQDWSLESSRWFGQREYQFTYYNVQSNAELEAPGSWIYQRAGNVEETEKFRQAERIYRSFVYDNYLELDEEQKTLIDTVFFQGHTQEEGKGLYTVTSRIRTVLRILADYKEIPARIPANKDFLTWFLQEGKEGNAAYYASAAVLAYRAAGIPARYVEGYILTKGQAEHTEGKTVTLTGKNTHAWAEVYIDGIGWRMVEVTPGFYEELYQADIVVAVLNETIDGAGGDNAGILTSEEYQFPDMEQEESSLQQNENGRLIFLVLGVLGIWILREIGRLIWSLYLQYHYKRMTEEEQMYFLYCEIMGMMGKLYKGFNPEQPLEIQKQEDIYDAALYERTIKRMEKIIYGQIKPVRREIRSTEALARQLQAVLRKRMRWRRIFRN
ncbi:transglutaminase-like domain-containing protein [Lachnospiraceae bacterium 62-35]